MYDILRRNLGYKLISLVVAILLWLWVTYTGTINAMTQEQTLNIPLVARNQPSNMIVMTKLPSVRVRVQGYNPSINVQDLYAYVDLSNAVPGEDNYPVVMDATPGIKVLDISPQNVLVNLDTVQEKLVPVQIALDGKPAEGFQAGTPILTPSTVNVRGPSTILEKLSHVVVELSIAGAKETVSVTRPVLFRDQAGQLIYGADATMETLNASPDSVQVIVPITQEGLASKTVPLRLSTTGTPAQGMALRSLSAVPSSIQVLGTPEQLQSINSVDLGAVDITGLSADKVFQVSSDRLALPSGITIPNKMEFTVIAKIGPEAQEKQLTGVTVSIRNVPAGLEAKAIEPVSVRIKGYPEYLDPVTSNQIQLWVDAAHLSVGEYPNTQVYYQLPAGVELVYVPRVTLVLVDPSAVETTTPEGGETPATET